MRERVAEEWIRFAVDVASDPSGVVRLWKAATGGKVVACFPATPIPEILHAAGLLPIVLESPADFSLLSAQVDAWMLGEYPSPFAVPSVKISRFAFTRLPPGSVEEALDRVEALAEWVSSESGTPISEGELWKSIRACAHRRSLQYVFNERCARDVAFLASEERRDIARAGIFLPTLTHSRLLSLILGIDHELAAVDAEGERGDPLLLLAHRLM